LRGNMANRVPKDPEMVLLEMYRFLERQSRRLPPRPQTRAAFARQLIGLIMEQFDLEAQKFTPLKIPDTFRSSRNRYGVGPGN